jgi:hypothetical protein
MLEKFTSCSLTCDLLSERPIVQYIENSFDISDSIVLHYRRGDYRRESQLRGLLNLNYYKKAIFKIPSIEYKNVVVVTDEPLQKLQDFELLSPNNVRIIDSTMNLYSTEIFNLFLKSKFLIMANSSLSWSAALFRSDKSRVFYPAPWFREIEFFNLQFHPLWRAVNVDKEFDYDD